MAIKPVVRYMILCDDWRADPANSRRITIVGLVTNLRVTGSSTFPFRLQELCVFLTLTDGYGRGEGRIVCADEETGQIIFETPPQPMLFGSDPLEVRGFAFRIRGCLFPRAGLYSVQFWYEQELVEERPLRLR